MYYQAPPLLPPWWHASPAAWHFALGMGYAGYGPQGFWQRQHRGIWPPLLSLQSAQLEADMLPEEPREIVLVNSMSSGAYDSLCADAELAELVAFDAEWRPDCYEGSDNPISVLQFAFPTSCRVYVVQLERFRGKLPAAVTTMLVNPEVTKAGFAVDNGDIVKFARTGIAVNRGSVVDVRDQCWQRLAGFGVASAYGKLSLKGAAERILGFSMNKDRKLTCSDWACDELTPEQIRYAGLDAWVTLRLYCSQYLAR